MHSFDLSKLDQCLAQCCQTFRSVQCTPADNARKRQALYRERERFAGQVISISGRALEFNDNKSLNNTRGHIFKLQKPRCNMSFRQQSFPVPCMDDWNRLKVIQS